MIILFRPNSVFGNPVYEPIVIVDYTRSDEQWSPSQISKYVKQLGTPLNGPISSNITTYSLDYAMAYTHNGISYGDSLKTKFTATIRNAPISLVNLLNIKQYTSQQNIEALKSVVNAVIDPQVQFPQGGFVIRSAANSKGEYETITRRFIIYSSPFDYDQKSRNSTLILNGAAFDNMVMRLQFAVDIKANQPLFTQIKTALAKKGITAKTDSPTLPTRLPAWAKYYTPAPIYDIISEICVDNNIAFDPEKDPTYIFQDLSPSSPPPQSVKQRYCFQNYVPQSKIMATFKPDNYTSATWEGEVYNAELFTSVAVYDDSFSQGVDSTGNVTPGVFSTYTKIPNAAVTTGSNKIDGYRFYIQSYTYYDSRDKTSLTITGTNNWLISIMRIDSLLENAIYKNQL
jgi:hypothetical protein